MGISKWTVLIGRPGFDTRSDTAFNSTTMWCELRSSRGEHEYDVDVASRLTCAYIGRAPRSRRRRSAGSVPPLTFHKAMTTPVGVTTTRSMTARMGHDALATTRIAAASPAASPADQGPTLVHFWLRVSAFCGIGGASRECLEVVLRVLRRCREVLGGVEGVFRVRYGSG